MAVSSTFPYEDHPFYLWLCGPSRTLTRTSAQDYAKWVLRDYKDWPLDCARTSGLCAPDATLESLSIAQLYQVIRICDGKFRTALWSYIDYRLEADGLAAPACAEGSGLSLMELLRTFSATIYNLRLKAGCDLVMGALLLDPELSLADKKETRDRCLVPTGKDYPRYRAICLENLRDRPMQVADALRRGLPRDLGIQRTQAARLAEKLTQTYAYAPGFSASRTRQLLLRMEGLAPAAVDWYSTLMDQEGRLTTYILRHMLALLEVSLRSRGQDFGRPMAVHPDDPRDLRLCALLAPFRRTLSVELYNTALLRSGGHIARLLELGLLRVEHAEDRSFLTASDEAFLTQDYSRLLQEVWEDPTLLPILNGLLECLHQRQQNGAGPEQTLILSQDLVSLLSAAPGEEVLATDTAAERTTELLTQIVTTCHWSVCKGVPTPEHLNSLQRLIRLYRARPRATAKALYPLLEQDMGVGHHFLKAALTWDDRLQESPALGDLYWRLGDSALVLSQDPSFPPERQLGFLSCALSACSHAAAIGGHLRERPLPKKQGGWFSDPVLAFDSTLLRVRAFPVLARLTVEAGQSGAETLLADALLPWAAALDRCRHWLKELSLLGLAQGQAEELDEAFRQTCRTLFAPDSPVAAALPPALRLSPDANMEEVGAWHQDQCRRRNKLPLKQRAAQQVDLSAPTIKQAREHTPSLYTYWYCDFMDSSLTFQRHYLQDELEAYLLKLLLSGQNVILSLNQIVDNGLLRALSAEPHFLTALRSAQIAVSFYQDFSDLPTYAAQQMNNPKFYWSSLSPDFNWDQTGELHQKAALYLDGSLGEDELPGVCRHMLIQFKEELTRLDEAIRDCDRVTFYQRPRPNGAFPTLLNQMQGYYQARSADPQFEEMSRIHTMITQALAPAQFNRSNYQYLLGRIKAGDFSALKLDPQWEGYLGRLWTPDNLKLLGWMQTVLDHCQNRVVGGLCSPFQHQIFSADDRFLIPMDESTPVSEQGVRLYQDIQFTTETGTCADWSQVAERRAHLDRLIRQPGSADPERLAHALSDPTLTYEPSEDGSALLLRRALLRSSSCRTQVVEQGSAGTIHLESEEN